jgi:hypothetical protein
MKKYILCCAFVILTQWVSIFNNLDKCQYIYFLFFRKLYTMLTSVICTHGMYFGTLIEMVSLQSFLC